MANYYEKQLERLTDKKTVTIKLTDYSGNSTNYMNLNVESIDSLISFLKAEKKNIVKSNKNKTLC
jgi:hypothetical protein